MAPLPSILDELLGWQQLPQTVIKQAARLLEPAHAVQRALGNAYTSVPIGVHRALDTDQLALHLPKEATGRDLGLVLGVLTKLADVHPTPLTDDQAGGGRWVKIATSPTLNSALQGLNFLPGTYPGGIPNHYGPAASMLTTGLVGGGLGYGTGWLMEKLMPEKWKRGRLRNTLGILGGLAGMAPGAAWALTNKMDGRPWNDKSLVEPNPMFRPQDYEQQAPEFNDLPLSGEHQAACKMAAARLGDVWREMEKEAGLPHYDADENSPERRPHSKFDVDVDALGRTLWDAQATPQTAGLVMGTLGAAQQMPGGSKPGWVTPMQMGNLAAGMGAGYISGKIVGSALGLLTGLPSDTQETLARTGMFAGLARALMPHVFGI